MMSQLWICSLVNSREMMQTVVPVSRPRKIPPPAKPSTIQKLLMGGDQQFFDAFLKFEAEEGGADVHVGVGDNAHHNQSRRNKLHIGEAFCHAYFVADKLAEDDKIQRHSDGRWNDRLTPDSDDTHAFLAHQGVEGEALALESHRRYCPLVMLRNNCSTRLVLLVMFLILMPALLSLLRASPSISTAVMFISSV